MSSGSCRDPNAGLLVVVTMVLVAAGLLLVCVVAMTSPPPIPPPPATPATAPVMSSVYGVGCGKKTPIMVHMSPIQILLSWPLLILTCTAEKMSTTMPNTACVKYLTVFALRTVLTIFDSSLKTSSGWISIFFVFFFVFFVVV